MQVIKTLLEKRVNMKTTRAAILLVLTAAAGLNGCYDYRSGKHWNLTDDRDWKPVSHLEWINQSCNPPVTVSTVRAGESYAHSLFFIPLGFGGGAGNPSTTSFIVTGEGLAGHCDSTALAVSVNGRTRNDTTISACSKTPDCCAISVPVSRDDMESVQVAINKTGASCSYAPLVLNSWRHVCLRETRFGGSDGCYY
ncbi:hypothetical protein [Pseudomonas sp. R2-7-07]|uniref:hypothetical protein n=1 Tax=Pseudomonas sp. R2-7-07 TaxID=658641 RepID=UPI000F560937|nr:hypothetical protein [Pseudomonas sp. R2-7-07]